MTDSFANAAAAERVSEARREWVKPTLQRMHAGSAEAAFTDTSDDGMDDFS